MRAPVGRAGRPSLGAPGPADGTPMAADYGRPAGRRFRPLPTGAWTAARGCGVASIEGAQNARMTEAMYCVDFRRMTVEEVKNREPPPGIDIGVAQTPEDCDHTSIRSAVMGTPPTREIDDR